MLSYSLGSITWTVCVPCLELKPEAVFPLSYYPRIAGYQSQGLPTPTYVDLLKRDVGADNSGELARWLETALEGPSEDDPVVVVELRKT